jgi:serine protease Do
MRRTYQFALVLFFGIIIGLYIYSRFTQQQKSEPDREDSLLVSELQAQELNQEIAVSRQNAITRAVQEISPAVVSVNVMQVQERILHSPFKTRDPWLREFFPEFFQDRRFIEEIKALGSGFLISEDGYILTNNHVVFNASKIMITMVGGDSADAEIIGSDFISDIALLKINKQNVPYIKLGDSDKVLLGEWAIAVGNPFGLFEISNYPTVTVGVISAIKRDFGEIGEQQQNMRIYPNMIQTDASINHGNSGGPLCNALGEVIGMNTFIYTDSPMHQGSVGIGFAIPINRIKAIISDLKQFRRVNRDVWIGIKVKDLTAAMARKNNYRTSDGAMVTHIELGSPADKAGIRLEDIIIGVEEKKVKNSDNLSELINMMDPIVGDTLQLSLLRDQKEIQVTLYLTSRK